MAGMGKRFADAGYRSPKPLLPVHGVPMYQVVLANMIHTQVESVTVIAQKSWGLHDSISQLNERIPQRLTLLEIDFTTGGPAETVSLARQGLAPDVPVVTGNSDQFVEGDISHLYGMLADKDTDGVILTMKDDHPKWSYASLNTDGSVAEVREKEVISEYATVGIYGFASADLLFHGIDLMMQARDTCNGEYYIGPSYNYLVREGRRILIHDVGPIDRAMHGLGTPEDYEKFLTSEVSHQAAAAARQLLGGPTGARYFPI